MTIVRWNPSPDIAAHQAQTSRTLEGFSSSHPPRLSRRGVLVRVQPGAREFPLLDSPRPQPDVPDCATPAAAIRPVRRRPLSPEAVRNPGT
jgi:hypothetical protein